MSKKIIMGGGSIFRKTSPYPQCKIFHCVKANYVTYRCCYFCGKKAECGWPCMNDPKKCGQCVIPPGKDGESMWKLEDDIPDAPDIARAERMGLRPGELPFDEPEINCPICGKLAETFYFDCDGTLFGCDQCVTRKEAGEYTEGEDE